MIRPLLVRSGAKPVIGLALGAVCGVTIVLGANVLRTVFMDLYFMLYINLTTSNPIYLPDLPGLFYVHFRSVIATKLAWTYFSDYLFFSWPALAVFVWLPLFALGILTARFLTPLSWIVGRTQWFLKEGKEHPLKAIGYVAAVAVFICTVTARAVFSA
jgi:hypothetical protein